MNHDTTHMFKVVPLSNREIDNDCDNFADSDFAFKCKTFFVNGLFVFDVIIILDVCNDETIDYKQLLKEESLKTNPKDRISINLPSVIKENSLIHKYSPFTFSDKDIKAFIKSAAGEVRLHISINNSKVSHIYLTFFLEHVPNTRFNTAKTGAGFDRKRTKTSRRRVQVHGCETALY